jgi:F-type H+-transporting ATPase subunit delta
MADNRVSRRYAYALFTATEKANVTKSVEDDLNAIAGMLENNEQFKTFILAPYTGREEKIKVVEKIFSDRVTALTMQVLRLLLTKRREEFIVGVRDEFVTLRREREGVIFAVISSAYDIDAQQKKSLVAQLEKTLGKTVEAEFKLEPHLVGGVKVAYGNYVLDGSIRGALSSLREKLRHDLLRQQ